MTLVANNGVVRLIAKAAEVDEAGAKELLRLATHDYLVEQIESARPTIERDIVEHVIKRTGEARRVLVRQYVSKRVDGQDVEDVIQTATHLAAVSETIAKHDGGEPGHTHNTQNEPRNAIGRWVKRFGDALGTLTGTQTAMGVVADSKPDEVMRSHAQTLLTGDRYQNLHRVGAGLTALGHPAATAVGQAAMIGAAIGPEAATVLGPHVQRTAYRYRGTEKTADKQLRQAINSQTVTEAKIKTVRADPKQMDDLRARASRGENEATSTTLAHLLSTPEGRRMTDQQLALRVRGDVAVGYLSDKIPDPDDTALSIAAGQLPPSQGVIINSAGNVVSESMGYNGDHFLPFDLKNLTGLHGGQYVRTRAAGGPTSEDIYTGLMSGARQMQVVSNSGVFTVEFDPDLRGARRYSDKAGQMVSRYQHILDAIDSGNLMANDLKPAEEMKIKRQAYEDAKGNTANATLLANERIAAERERRKYNVKDHEELEAEADQAVKEYVQNLPRGGPRLSPGDIADKKREVLDDLYEEQKNTSVRALKLDGEGYARALRALKTEFPYYIRAVDFQERPRFLQQRRLIPPGEAAPKRGKGTDQGYVQPGAVGEARNHAISVADHRAQGFYDRSGLTRPQSESGGRTDSTDDKDSTKPKSNTDSRIPTSGLMLDTNSPKLTDLLKDRHLAAVVGRAEAKLAELASQVANEDDTTKIPLNSVRTWNAAAQLNWVNQNHGTGEELINGILKGTVPEEVADLYTQALDKFLKLKGGRIDAVKEQYPDDYSEGMAGGRTVQSVLAMRNPFSPAGDPAGEPGREAVKAGRPMFSAKVVDAGIAPENFKALYNTLTKDVAKQVDEYRKPSADPLDDLDTLYSELDAADRETSPAQKAMMVTEAKKELDTKHQAWTFVHAERLAAEARALTGRDADPKAPTPGQDAFTMADWDDPKDVGKRLMLPSSSLIATEFRKFLQSR